jgi:hypothetical protein
MFKEIIETKQTSFERKLGAPIVLFLEILKYRLEIYGKEIGGKKGFGATKKLVVLITKQLVQEHNEVNCKVDINQTDEAMTTSFKARSAVECFSELLEMEGIKVHGEAAESIQLELNQMSVESSGHGKDRDAVNGESDYEVSDMTVNGHMKQCIIVLFLLHAERDIQ